MAGTMQMETGSGPLTGQTRSAAEQAKQAAEQAKQKVSQRLGEQKGSVARQLNEVAQALRKTADNYDERQQGGPIGSFARQAADGIERFSAAIERKNLSDMFGEFERLCRERPVLVGAAALMAGFIGTRIARGATAHGESHIAKDVEPHPDPLDVMRSEGGI
jgi:hypothetical protein